MISEILDNTFKSIISIIKILLKSRHATISKKDVNSDSIIIMGNGPSLNETIASHRDVLCNFPTLAVNFAANSPEFKILKPRYYAIADPAMFALKNNPTIEQLKQNLSAVDWQMTLFIPCTARGAMNALRNENLKIEYFNAIAVEGFQWIEDLAFKSGRGMPRPRNVLIPSIMIAMKMGYKNIYITGADHSWTQTLSVNEKNEVVSIQPHFYKEDESEEKRVKADYLKIKLHQVIYSLYVAFKSYHTIQGYATRSGINIFNSTPQSFIDAFPRKSLKDIMK